MTCDDETISTASNSRIMEWLEKISSEISSQHSSRSNTPDNNNSLEQKNLDALLKSSIRGKIVIDHYATFDNLNNKKQNELVHIIIDNFLVQRKKMSYNDMNQWANAIEQYFPNEKSVSFFKFIW